MKNIAIFAFIAASVAFSGAASAKELPALYSAKPRADIPNLSQKQKDELKLQFIIVSSEPSAPKAHCIKGAHLAQTIDGKQFCLPLMDYADLSAHNLIAD